MIHPSYNELSVVFDKLMHNDFRMSDRQLVTLLWITSLNGVDAQQKAEAALHLVVSIEQMVQDIHSDIQAECSRNPVFSARLIPLYEAYETSIQDTRMELFYRICRALIEDTWIFNDFIFAQEPPEQLELNFDLDSGEF